MNRKDTAKTFMFVCFGLAALAGAVQFVAPDAVAQSTEPTAVATAFYVPGLHSIDEHICVAIMTNGDVYKTPSWLQEWTFQCNIFTTAGAVPLSGSSMGEVKRLFRK